MEKGKGYAINGGGTAASNARIIHCPTDTALCHELFHEPRRYIIR